MKVPKVKQAKSSEAPGSIYLERKTRSKSWSRSFWWDLVQLFYKDSLCLTCIKQPTRNPSSSNDTQYNNKASGVYHRTGLPEWWPVILSSSNVETSSHSVSFTHSNKNSKTRNKFGNTVTPLTTLSFLKYNGTPFWPPQLTLPDDSSS